MHTSTVKRLGHTSYHTPHHHQMKGRNTKYFKTTQNASELKLSRRYTRSNTPARKPLAIAQFYISVQRSYSPLFLSSSSITLAYRTKRGYPKLIIKTFYFVKRHIPAVVLHITNPDKFIKHFHNITSKRTRVRAIIMLRL